MMDAPEALAENCGNQTAPAEVLLRVWQNDPGNLAAFLEASAQYIISLAQSRGVSEMTVKRGMLAASNKVTILRNTLEEELRAAGASESDVENIAGRLANGRFRTRVYSSQRPESVIM